MFNKAYREWKKEIRSYKKERKHKLYNGWDIGKTGSEIVTKNGVDYYMVWPVRRVVDDYGPDGSVELDHHESTGYGIVNGYSANEDIDTLDFTFIRPQDEIKIKVDEKIKNIKMNASNLRYAKIKSSNPLNIKIVIDTGKIDRLIGLKEFANNNKDIIKDIKFVKKKDELNEMLDDKESKIEDDNKTK